MAEILFVRNSPLGRFYVHRVSRIFPALWLFVFSMLVATQFAPRLNVDWRGVLTALTFTRNYIPSEDCLGHIWSLCVEEHAYILLSLIALAARRTSIAVVPILLTITAAMALNGMAGYWLFQRETPYWASDVRIASILISAAMFLSLRHKKFPTFLAVAALAIGFVLYLIGSVPLPIKHTVSTCLIAFGFTALRAESWVGRALSVPGLTHLGLWSFSLYLWQQPFSHYYAYPKPVLIFMLAFVAISTFYFFERPMRSLINSYFDAFRLVRFERLVTIVSLIRR